MKKIILSILIISFFAGIAHTKWNKSSLAPISFDRTTDALNIYITGGSTTSAATRQVHADSMTFTTTGGLYPGTTQYVFADTDKDTLDEFIVFLNAVSATTAGAEGGIVAVKIQGAYGKNDSSELTVAASAGCLGSDNVSKLTFANTLGISYTIAASGLSGLQLYKITGMSVNVTFASGTTYLYIYDGTDNTATRLLKYEIDTTATETPIHAIPSDGSFIGSNNTAMTIEVVGSANITAGYFNFAGFKD